MDAIKQKKNFTNRELKIKENKVFYKFGKFGNENEMVIPFENISGEKVSNETGRTGLLIGGIITIVISIGLIVLRFFEEDIEKYAELFWLIIGFVLLSIYYITKEKFWKIKLRNDDYIYLHKSIPNQKSVDDFISVMIEKRDKYLVANYGQINKNLDYENQYQNWKWLLNINAINKKEFEQKEDELNKIFGKEERTIGFRKK